MKEWRHALCADCWDERNPKRRVGLDVRMAPRGDHERCCVCTRCTFSGIYVRFDPAECALKGKHDKGYAEERL